MDTTAQRVVSASLPKSQPVLRILFVGDAGIVQRPPYVLSEPTVQIGRALDGAGILLSEDRQVSRLHATLHRQIEGFFLVDENSRNGTFVNGQRIESRASSNTASGMAGQLLHDGELLRIGDSFLLFREEPIASEDASIPELIGRSPVLRAVRHAIKQVAATQAMVLLLGETGTGKEVAARALHRLSERQGPFIAVNCSAIPESLAESQLFGHVRGAFTSAGPHDGLFRAAHGGTLFLDEVGELTPALQPKLLRALEEKAVLPVGATHPVACDVRIIAATNRPLRQDVQGGLFRGDLLSRLSEFTLVLPPLRQRREDILLLFAHAMQQAAPSMPMPRLHPDLAERLLLFDWPFNVRELIKTTAELRIRGKGLSELGPELIADRLMLEKGMEPAESRDGAPGAAERGARSRTAAPSERGPIPSAEELTGLLTRHKGIVTEIAKAMRRSRAQVYRWLEQRGLDPDRFRS